MKRSLISSNCDRENRVLTFHSSLSSVLSCTLSSLIGHFTYTHTQTSPQQQRRPRLHYHRKQIYRFCMTSKSLTHQGFHRLGFNQVRETGPSPSSEGNGPPESSPGFYWKVPWIYWAKHGLYLRLASVAWQRIGFCWIFTVPSLSLQWPHI